MTTRDSPVTEDELHAHVDGELPADRSEAVSAWLSEHPEQAALVAAWRAQADAIRARYGAVAEAPESAGTITADALEAHKLYVVEVRHPVEVPGTERAHMTKWLSKRVGHEQRIPNLQSIGLKLVGGRLLPGPTGAAAFYMYEGASGERFTIYCSKVTRSDTALRFHDGKPFAAFTWVDGKIGYVVSGPDERERLERVTKLIYEQIDRTGARKS